MPYIYNRKKRHKMKSGEKRVLLFSIPAALIVALTVQLTLKGIPKFFDSFLTKIKEETERSHKMIEAYAIKAAKSGDFTTGKNIQIDQGRTTNSKNSEKASNQKSEYVETILNNYRKAQKDTWDATYQEIERRELKEDIKKYQDLFEKEKKQ
jgi:hypothetical protein